MFFDPSGVTFADIRHFHDPSPDTCGWHGVYQVESAYVAKAFKKRISPPCRTPREAARYAAAWWAGVYGPTWPLIFRGRKAEGWHVLRCPSGEGYRVLASVVPTPGLCSFHPTGSWYLRPFRDKIAASPKRGNVPDFLTAPDAKAGYRQWVWQTFGLFSARAGYYVRRWAMEAAPTPEDEPVKLTRSRQVPVLVGR